MSKKDRNSSLKYQKMRNSYYSVMAPKFRSMRKYYRWFDNDYTDLAIDIATEDGEAKPVEVAAVNQLSLVARAHVAHMYFNHPTIVVKREPGFERDKGTSDIAEVLAPIANQIFAENNALSEGQRATYDSFMSPFFVMMCGYNATRGQDIKAIQQQRDKAAKENLLMLQGSPVVLQKSDIDKLHEDAHSKFLEELLNGDFDRNLGGKAPEAIIDAVKKHLEAHKNNNGRTTAERVTSERIFLRHIRPDLVFFDLASPNINRLTWVGWSNLVPLEELKKDPRFSKAGIPETGDNLKISKDIETDEILATDLDDGIERVWLHEMFLLSEGRRIAWVEGQDTLVLNIDYEDMDIMPNGPFVISYLVPDMKSIVGIPPAKFIENQLEDLIILHTIKIVNAKMSVPGIAYDSGVYTEEEIQKFYSSILGRKIGTRDALENNKDLKDTISDIPMPRIAREVLEAERSSLEFIQTCSGMGATRLSGGDTARTATASELIDQAVSALTKASAVVIDEFFKNISKLVLRMVKKYYSTTTVSKYVGKEGVELWPDYGFTDQQILDDRGIEIVVGTMRRETTDIQLKLMMNLLQILLSNQMLMSTQAGQLASMKLLNYIFQLHGAPINLLNEIKASLAEPPPKPEGTSRVPAGTSGDSISMRQGVHNVTGGGDGG